MREALNRTVHHSCLLLVTVGLSSVSLMMAAAPNGLGIFEEESGSSKAVCCCFGLVTKNLAAYRHGTVLKLLIHTFRHLHE